MSYKNYGKLSNGINLQINIYKGKVTIQELMFLEMAEVKETSLKAIPVTLKEFKLSSEICTTQKLVKSKQQCEQENYTDWLESFGKTVFEQNVF